MGKTLIEQGFLKCDDEQKCVMCGKLTDLVDYGVEQRLCSIDCQALFMKKIGYQ